MDAYLEEALYGSERLPLSNGDGTSIETSSGVSIETGPACGRWVIVVIVVTTLIITGLIIWFKS